jgi:hypothetical protein
MHAAISKEYKMKNDRLRQQLNWKDVGRLAVEIRRDRCGRILEILYFQ